MPTTIVVDINIQQKVIVGNNTQFPSMGSDDPPLPPPTLGVENVKIRENSEIRKEPLQSLQQNVIIALTGTLSR